MDLDLDANINTNLADSLRGAQWVQQENNPRQSTHTMTNIYMCLYKVNLDQVRQRKWVEERWTLSFANTTHK